MLFRAAAVLPVLAVLLVVTGCAGEPDAVEVALSPTASTEVATNLDVEAAESSTTTEMDKRGDDAALTYFEGVAAGAEPTGAEFGSPAYFYALYLSEVYRLDGTPESTIEVDDDRVVLTSRNPNGTSDSTIYGDITLSQDGVRSFSVGDAPLTDRIATASDPVEVDSVVVQHVISYLSNSNLHLVTASITNNTATEFNTVGASFVDDAGRQFEVSYFLGTGGGIRAGATGVIAMEFPVGDVAAGTVYLDGVIDDYHTKVALVIPVTPLD